jgi:hypothetical protein
MGRLVVAETANQTQTEVGPDPDTNQTKPTMRVYSNLG